MANSRWGTLDEARAVPSLGIHVMTEFEYCPRAGLVAYESNQEDTGEESSVENLDYLPLYDLREINRELNLRCPVVYRWLAVGGTIVVLTVILSLLVRWYFIFCGAIGLAVVTAALIDLLGPIIILVKSRAKAERAQPRTPDLDSPEDEPIDWWEMRRSGFEAATYKEPLVDPELRLAGKPWKVLRDYDVVVPVFKRNSSKPLQRQVYARIAAYCRLIERCEGVTCPYGLVLQAGTYQATAVKNTAAAHDMLHAVLDKARAVIREVAETGSDPVPPASSKPCLHCPIGFPRVYRPDETELIINDERLPIRPAYTTRRGIVYHSQCGDRFRWTPAHERVERYKAGRRW